MAAARRLTLEDARRIGDRLGVDWDAIDPAELRRGIEVEVEQDDGGSDDGGDDLLSAGRVAWLRLREVPDFYTRLDELAAAAEKHRARRFRL